MSDENPLAGLSTRASICVSDKASFMGMTYPQLKHAIAAGMINPLKWRNVGKKTNAEIFAWANANLVCPTCQRPWPKP